jgi:PRTRC genetic system ParB family protein
MFQREIQNIPVQKILPGNNPRSYFDSAETKELEASVKLFGVIQPIAVRVDGENFIISAGERRHRAAVKVGLETIPAVILGMDEDADAIALIENALRANLSPAEESIAATQLVKKHKSRDEVLRILGWSSSHLVRRLALQMCHVDVLQALTERKILLGHAELLAAAPKDKQAQVLPKVLALNMSVADLKKAMATYIQDLGTAPFPKDQCARCPHNTGNHAQLFSELMEHGRCTNPPCFESKISAFIEAVRVEQADTYPRVEIVQIGEENYSPLSPEQVGQNQFDSGCKTCSNFGCAIQTAPGHQGEVESPVCFDSVCKVAKIALYKTPPKTEKAATAPRAAPGASTSENPADSAPPADASTPDSPKPAFSSLRAPVSDHRRVIWNKCLLKFFQESTPEIAARALVSMLITHHNPDRDHLGKIFTKLLGSTPGGIAAALAATREAPTATMILGVLASCIQGASSSDVEAMLLFNNVDISKYWKIDSAFLTVLTKSEIEAVLDDVGYTAIKREDELKKILSGKKAEIIAAVLADTAFIWCKVPAVMQYQKA